jgi:purine-binding chemotaxis protein CheW
MRLVTTRDADAACRFLRFDVQGLPCAISLPHVTEVVRAVALEPLPGASPFVAGLVNLRGVLLPVLDLRVRFGYAARCLEPSDRFVMVRVRKMAVALWVDAAVDLIALDTDTIVPSDGLTAGVRSLAGVARTADGVLYIHDPAAFLNQAEADALYTGVAS